VVTLFDAHGRPIQRNNLKEEESAPSMRGVRQVFSSYPSSGITPQGLASILRQADQGNPYAQCELFEEMEEKDLHLISIMGTRKRAVSGLEIIVEAPDSPTIAEQKATDLVKDHMRSIAAFPEKLEGILDAIGKGYSVTEIIWGIHKQEAIITDLKWREPKWFRFDQESMSELRLLDAGYADGKPLTPFKYITHIHKAKAGIAVRGGILRPCAWMYLFKNYDFKDWVTFAEIYAQPLRVGKYPNSASENEKDILLNAVASMGTDAAAIIPDSMRIEFIEAGGKTGSTDLYERLARFCDEQMSKGVLGQTSSADAMSGGLGSGQADLHGEVRDDLLKADARQLGATLTRDICKPLVDLNMGPVDRYPKITVFIEDPEDLKELGDNAERLHRMGLPIGQDFLYKKFNIPKPQAGDAVLQMSAGSITGADSNTLDAAVAANAQETVGIPQQTILAAAARSMDKLAEQLEAEAAPITDAMIDRVRKLMDEVETLEELSERIPELLGDMDTSKLTELMAKAFVTADLVGQHEVINDGDE